MRKFFRFMLILIIIIVVAVLVLGVVEPKDVVVQRSTLIKAPKDMVFNQIVNFKNWVNWNPWYQMDSSEKITYTGADGQPGSTFHWVGDPKKTGEGQMTDTAVKGTEMDYSLHTITPFNHVAGGFMSAEDAGNGMTRVTWSITMHSSFPWNASFAFVKMDKLLGGDFERGLQNMKKYCEAMAANTGVQIQETVYPAHIFEGVRKTVAMTDVLKFCADTYSQLDKSAGALVNGPAVGIYYTWDTLHHTTDMVAALPVSDTSKAINGASCIYIPQSKALMAVHKGPYSTMMMEHGMLMKSVTDKKLQSTLVLEEYVVGPRQDKDSTKWVTNIYYLVH